MINDKHDYFTLCAYVWGKHHTTQQSKCPEMMAHTLQECLCNLWSGMDLRSHVGLNVNIIAVGLSSATCMRNSVPTNLNNILYEVSHSHVYYNGCIVHCMNTVLCTHITLYSHAHRLLYDNYLTTLPFGIFSQQAQLTTL